MMKIYTAYVILILWIMLGCLEISCVEEDKINLNKGTLLLFVAYKKKYDTPIYDVNFEIYNIKDEVEYKISYELKEDQEGKNYSKEDGELDKNKPFDNVEDDNENGKEKEKDQENLEKVKSPYRMIGENINNPFNAISNLYKKRNNMKREEYRRSKRDSRTRRNRHKFRPSPLLSGG